MQIECQQNLVSIAALVKKLSSEQYQFPSSYLSGASIGQHIRHVLEFYTCLSDAFNNAGDVDYDERKRAIVLEKEPEEANIVIEQVICWLSTERIEGEIQLKAGYKVTEDQACIIPSTFQRELAYCLEHSIHHQALIKIGLLEQGLSKLIDPDFGVAPSTIKFRMKSGPASS